MTMPFTPILYDMFIAKSRALLPRLAAARAAGVVVVPGEPTEEMSSRPWHIGYEWPDGGRTVRDRVNILVCEATTNDQAKLIIAAVNSYRLAAVPAVGEPEKRGEQ